jgi:hypothetical protein
VRVVVQPAGIFVLAGLRVKPTTATFALAVPLPKLAGTLAVTRIGPPTATPLASKVTLVWPARIVALAGIETVLGAAEVSVTRVSVGWACVMVAVSVAFPQYRSCYWLV